MCLWLARCGLNMRMLIILPRMKICENRMSESALKMERIGEVVLIIRL